MDEPETVTPAEETAPEVTPDVAEAPVEVAPEEPVEEKLVLDTDIAPEDVPVIHEDDGSVGRELDHVVQQ